MPSTKTPKSRTPKTRPPKTRTPKSRMMQSGGSTHNKIETMPDADGYNGMLWLWVILLIVCIVIYFIIQNNKLTDKILDAIPINSKKNANIENYKKKRDNYIAELEDEQIVSDPVRQPGYNGLRNVGIGADNINNISYQKYIQMKNYDRVINPLLPPERSFENTYGIPINIPSRGMSGGYQQIGMLYKDNIISEDSIIGKNSNSVIMPLYGRPTHPGSNKWNYYITSDKFHAVKMPININGKDSDDTYGVNELFDNDNVQLPAYNGSFVVKIYNYDKPRYIPYVL